MSAMLGHASDDVRRQLRGPQMVGDERGVRFVYEEDER